MESFSAGSLQVLHIHVLFVASLGADHMVQPGADQHESRVTVRETAHHAVAAANPVQPLHDMVGANASPVFTGKIAVDREHLICTFVYFCLVREPSRCSLLLTLYNMRFFFYRLFKGIQSRIIPV